MDKGTSELARTQEHMRQALRCALNVIFPSGRDTESLIKRHRWGNPDYVGSHDGAVVWWTGWSANLSAINRHYRTIYIDYVENLLSEAVRTQVFGKEFADLIRNVPSFVVMYVGGFGSNQKAKVAADGFTVRSMGKNIHPCFVSSTETFLNHTELHWAALIARLILYQAQVLGT